MTLDTRVRYLLIDEDGDLREDTAPDWMAALDSVGPEGWAKVRLDAQSAMGYVNDCGLILPQYRRNIVGACMLVCAGAVSQAYAGPVVFTGWDDGDPESAEVCSLDDDQVTTLRRLHADVRRALGMDAGDPRAFDLLSLDEAAALRGYADWLPGAKTPPITVLSGDEALAHLRSMRDGA